MSFQSADENRQGERSAAKNCRENRLNGESGNRMENLSPFGIQRPEGKDSIKKKQNRDDGFGK